jgi:hypothetical protein
MSLTPIQVLVLRPRIRVTETDYFEERSRLEEQGWNFLTEAFEELPIGI